MNELFAYSFSQKNKKIKKDDEKCKKK